MVNEVASAITFTITGGATTGQDITHTVNCNAGDRIAWKIVTSGTAVTAMPRGCSLQWEGTTDNQFCVPIGSISAYAAGGVERFNRLLSAGTWDTTRTNRQSICPLNATLTGFYVLLNVAPGVDEEITLALYKNGAWEGSTVVTIAGTAKTGNVTGLSISTSPGDTWSIAATSTAFAATTARICGVAIFTPGTNGESWIGGGSTDTLTASATTEYNWFGAATGVWSTTERYFYVGTDFVLKNFRAILSVAPGVGHTYTIRVRKNTANGNSVLTFANTTTETDGSNSESLVATDEFGISATGDASITVSFMDWSAIQYIAPPASATVNLRTLMGVGT
jgi:hypothetical protein